jgi:DNA repair ATPase RecN
MGRKSAFTQSEIFEVADRLAAEGKEVSATALHDALGGGSLTTIYRHLNEWRAANPTALSAVIPVEMPDSVQGAFAAAWRTAVTEAGREIALAKEKAAEEVKAARTQFQEALASIERLEKEAESDAAQIETLTAKNQQLETALHKSSSECAALTATVDQLREQIKSLNHASQQAQKRADKAEQLLEKSNKDREAALKEAAEMRGQFQALKQQNDSLMAKLTPKSK